MNSTNRRGGRPRRPWLQLALFLGLPATAAAQLVTPGSASAPVVGASGSAIAPTTVTAPSDEPVLRPGDQVRITVWRQPEMSGEFAVAEDGTITHPLYREVRVAGLTASRAEAELRTFLTRFEQSPQLVLQPLLRVTVGGEVRQPNLYALVPGTTLQQAIAMAGGPSERGNLRKVRLVRNGRTTTVDLLAPAEGAVTTTIASGDQILVARRSSFFSDVLAPTASLAAAAAAVVSIFAQ